jgi:hypothetical protein
MSKFLEKIIKEQVILYGNNLCESGYSRLLQIMRGNVPTIYSIGILTAENPAGMGRLPKEENNKRNAELENDLRSYNYGYNKIGGKFDYEENSFFVNNVEKEHLLELGKKYGQQSVIYGYRLSDDSFEFQYIDCDAGVVNSRKVFNNVKDADKMYSEFKGKKFIIPFFDEEYEGAEWDGGVVTYELGEKDLNNLDEEARKAIVVIQKKSMNLVNEKYIPKHKWESRGIINHFMRILERKLNGGKK